ncbi:MAG: large subunit ribosomal protein L9 [Lentimonas sp.]|jgi:large subunit ribosomal protein L9
MKVILISRVAKLGNIGDVITTKDGYAKNFLIPQNKAIFYSVANYKQFEAKKQQIESENQDHSVKAEVNKAKLIGKNIIILENSSDDGRLYGSITTNLIAEKINQVIGEKVISKINIILTKPIKELGVYEIKVDLHAGILADVRIVVSRSESEVEKVIATFEAEKSKRSAEKEQFKKAQEKVEAKKEEKEVVEEKTEEVQA